MLRILREAPRDLDEVEALLDLAFAPGRTALSSYRLRDGVPPLAELSLVARDDYDAVAGAIRYWPVRVGAAGAAALLLGPVAVHPTRQGEGLGALLITESLDRAADLGWNRIILVGDEPYYRRFGFSRAAARSLDYPPPTNPDRLLARALAPGAFDGVSGMVRRWEDDQASGSNPASA
ncbi:MAG: N-acetyltransferase [Amaricoccus sp.]|uniref:GNAT family N-acetyltransferase n=1 Tax=Amaricoccus sp. TaxID=1872485 RepID=UPI0039E46501